MGGWEPEASEEDPEPLVAPSVMSLLQSVARLQRMERGRYMGLREKRPVVRRAVLAIKWYCLHGAVMSVLAIYQLLGGVFTGETSVESMTSFLAEEITSLATVAFSGDQEGLSNFISLFPR